MDDEDENWITKLVIPQLEYDVLITIMSSRTCHGTFSFKEKRSFLVWPNYFLIRMF